MIIIHSDFPKNAHSVSPQKGGVGLSSSSVMYPHTIFFRVPNTRMVLVPSVGIITTPLSVIVIDILFHAICLFHDSPVFRQNHRSPYNRVIMARLPCCFISSLIISVTALNIGKIHTYKVGSVSDIHLSMMVCCPLAQPS
jgi:hypothetical protein